MANYANLKAAIDTVIKANGQQEITGTVLNQTLTAMVNSLGAGYLFMGVAIPSTNPGTPDQNVFYLAGQAGTYSNFDATTLQAGLSILKWNGTWSSETLFTFDASITQNSTNPIASGAVFEKLKIDGGAYDVSAHNNNQTFASLSALLNDANLSTLIPTNIRSGGMSIKFVQSSDNKYVQFRYMDTETTGNPNPFLNIANWQGVDNEPTKDSHNLVESRYVYEIKQNTQNLKSLNLLNTQINKALSHNDKTIKDAGNGKLLYYDLTDVDKIFLYGSTWLWVINVWDILWICDSDNNVIYQERVTQEYQHFNKTISVPNNASYAILCASNSETSTYQAYLYSVSNVPICIKTANIEKEVEEHEGDIEDLKNNVEDVLRKELPIESRHNGALTTAGSITAAGNYSYIIVDVENYDKVYVSAKVDVFLLSQWAAWQLWDENNTFLSAKPITAVGREYDNIEVNVSNAKYIYVQADRSASVSIKYNAKESIQYLYEEQVSLDERVDNLEDNKKTIICWGDSLTNGAGITPYTVYLQQLLPNNYTVYNGGVEGDSTGGIINRQGGNSPKVLEDFTLPSTTEEINAPISIASLIYPGNGTNSKSLVNPCTIKGIECTVSKTTLGGGYTIKRNVAADNSENIKAGTQIITYGAKYMRDCDIAIFYCGQNDGVSNYESTIRLINKGINFLQKKNYIVISTAISRSADYENAFYAAYGVNYINLYHMMSNYGIETGIQLGLINEGTPATSWNTVDATGSNKNGLLKDTIHWNVNGLKVLANFVYNRLVEIGYVKLE